MQTQMRRISFALVGYGRFGKHYANVLHHHPNAVVEVICETDHIALQQAVFANQGNEVSPAVISDKYHADIMTDNTYDFGDNEVQVKEGEPQAHAFA